MGKAVTVTVTKCLGINDKNLLTKQNSFVIVRNDASVRQLFMRRTEPKDKLNIFREGVVRMKM